MKIMKHVHPPSPPPPPQQPKNQQHRESNTTDGLAAAQSGWDYYCPVCRIVGSSALPIAVLILVRTFIRLSSLHPVPLLFFSSFCFLFFVQPFQCSHTVQDTKIITRSIDRDWVSCLGYGPLYTIPSTKTHPDFLVCCKPHPGFLVVLFLIRPVLLKTSPRLFCCPVSYKDCTVCLQ